MSQMATALRGLADTIAKMRNSEPAVIFGDGTFSIEYMNPENTENYAWDGSIYQTGCVFLEGYANPVEVNGEPDNLDLEPSQKYRMFMKNHVISQALSVKGAKQDTLYKLLIAVLGVQIVTTVILIAVITQ